MALKDSDIEAALAALGVTDFTVGCAPAHLGGGWELEAWSPVGKVWSATGCHSLVISRCDDEKPAGLRRSALEDIREGLDSCEDAECETCHPDD